jgi:hypothetical protein
MTGRRSATWTTSPVVRLEKRVPPPQPAPPAPSGAALEPNAVRARIIQRGAPGLTGEDVTRLGERDSVIVLEWSWTDEERAADPFATEFRVYFRGRPFDEVAGELRGPMVSDGPAWRAKLVCDRDVNDGELVGAWVSDGSLRFRLIDHGAGPAGSEFDVRLARRKVVPVQPRLGPVKLRLTTRGDETRPGSYDERSAAIAIEPGRADYGHEWSDPVTVSAEEVRRIL